MRHLLLLLLTIPACTEPTHRPPDPLPACEWCGAQDAPDNLTHVATLVDKDEPRRPITLRGVVYHPDGITPAPNVLIYAYNTDDTGVYRTDGSETGNGRRHGQLRGWLRTDEAGRYEIRTIYPGGYPGREESSHVHLTLTPPGGEEYWIDATLFDDDPRLTEQQRSAHVGTGSFNPIVTLVDDVGVRDVKLR